MIVTPTAHPLPRLRKIALPLLATALCHAESAPWKLTGQVMNARTHSPVARALVRFRDRAALTDREGRFTFEQLLQDGEVQVTKPNFLSASEFFIEAPRHIGARQGSTPITLLLYPEAVLTGTLTSPEGEPMAGVLVTAWRRLVVDDRKTWNNTADFTSDIHGRFRISVPPGHYKITTPYGPAGADMPDEVLLPLQMPEETGESIYIGAGEERRFDLHPLLRRTHTVTAKLEGVPAMATSSSPTGAFSVFMGAEPISEVTAVSSAGTLLHLRTATHEAQGTFEVKLPNGRWKLQLLHGAHDYAETTVTVADRDVAGVVFHATPWPVLPIEVDTDASALPGGMSSLALELERLDDLPMRRFFPERRELKWVFRVPPGRYRLRGRPRQSFVQAARSGGVDLLQEEWIVGADAAGLPIHLEVGNRSGSLHGTVDVAGEPGQAWVYALPEEPGLADLYRAQSGDDGSFTFAALPPGRYRVVAFEDRQDVDDGASSVLRFGERRVQSATVQPDVAATLNLDALLSSEVAVP